MKKPSKCARFLLLSCALYCLPLPGNANGNSDRVLSSKLDQLQDKIMEQLEARLTSMQERMERKFGEHMVALQRAEKNKFLVLKDAIKQNSGAYFASCRGVPSGHSNMFMIRPSVPNTLPFMVYCEQSYLGGSWMVIHKRFDGTLDFNRGWEEYKEGFGEPNGEHWIGLEKIHRITQSGDHELLVVLKDFDGRAKMALYDGFDVDTEGAKYKLSIGKYDHGDAGDSLSLVNGARFSAIDQDNDQHLDGFCAKHYQSGWWFKYCSNSNLNGLYRSTDENNMTMNWFSFRHDLQGLKEASMMIREKVKVG